MSLEIEKYYRIVCSDRLDYEFLSTSDIFFDMYPDLTGEYEEDIQIARYKIRCLLDQERY